MTLVKYYGVCCVCQNSGTDEKQINSQAEPSPTCVCVCACVCGSSHIPSQNRYANIAHVDRVLVLMAYVLSLGVTHQ